MNTGVHFLGQRLDISAAVGSWSVGLSSSLTFAARSALSAKPVLLELVIVDAAGRVETVEPIGDVPVVRQAGDVGFVRERAAGVGDK